MTPRILFAAATAIALTAPSIGNAAAVQVDWYIDGSQGTLSYDDFSGGFSKTVGDTRISALWDVDLDPQIHIGVIAIDKGLPSTFKVAVTMFFPPVAASHYNYELSGSVSMTDGQPHNGVSIAPSGLSFNSQALPGIFTAFKDDQLVDSIGGASPVYFPGSGSAVWGPFGAAGTDCIGGGCTSQTLVVAFTGSGNGDVYGITGQLVNKPVPLPAAVPLFVSGLAGLGLNGWRKRRHLA